MNNLKFRVWDYNEWSDPNTWFVGLNGRLGRLSGDGESYFFYDSHDCIIQQWTGLLDKNGREIYEGDILEEKGLIFVAEWKKSMFTLSCKNSEIILIYDDWNYEENLDLIIIGNIFKNPERLK
jgi:hypothetical protein